MQNSKNHEELLWIEQMSNRSKIYSFFAQIFMEPIPVPGEKYANTMLNNVSILVNCSENKTEGFRLLKTFYDSCLLLTAQAIQEKIAVDRTFLCRGINQAVGPVPPYESLYIKEQHDSNTIIKLLRFYQQSGFAISKNIHERPDYIGVELSFMSELCQREFNQIKEPQYIEIIKQKQNFYQNHLSKWIPDFCLQVVEYAKTDFFKGLAYFLIDFIKEEKKYLNKALNQL
ncbi:TorD/DmsD family molecular chaperone [Dehalobacter sp. 4CP]|uniref:TorD/DmsD family molecular chaperone n=1 Tax=Dehalobacter sp. CP TaxID=2594474 RepID=UPI0039E9091E